MNPPFSIGESLKFGWQKTRGNSKLLFQVMLIIIGAEIIEAILRAIISNTILNGAILILFAIFEVAMGIGVTVIVLKLARSEPAILRAVIPSWRIAVRYLLASLAAGILVALGLVIPSGIGLLLGSVLPSGAALFARVLGIGIGILCGGYLILRYSMVKLSAVDGERKVADVLRFSAHLSEGVKWKLLLLFIAVALLNIAGAILALIGLLVTIPVTAIALAHVYVKLCERG